jgi:hypothetical protein
MVKVGDRNYKLCFIDTCIISELLKNKETFGKKVFPRFIEEQRLFCYSLKNIEELKYCEDIFNEFFKYCSVVPTFILKDNLMLTDEEVANYDNENFIIDPILMHFNMLKGDDYYEQMKRIFENDKIKNYFKENKELKPHILQLMLDNVKKYPKENVFHEKKYIDSWVEGELYKILFENHKDFINKKIKMKEPINYNKFHSLKSITYIRFYKFYLRHRNPKNSDINDIHMSCVFPYVDSVFLEKDMSEHVNQIKKKHNFYNNLEVLKLKEFLNK